MKMNSIAAVMGFGIISMAVLARGSTLYGVYGSDGSEHLISFSSALPGTLTEDVSLSGLVGSDTLFDIAFEPSTGILYGLGSQNLYTINTVTGAVTQVGSTLSQTFGGTLVGFNFDPVTGLIHIVGSGTQANLTMNPTTGAITTGTPAAFGSGDVNAGNTPAVGAVAFSNNFAGATSTTMYDLSVSGEVATLATENESTGTLSTVGSSGSGFGGAPLGLTISSTGVAFAAVQLNVIDPGNTRLYSVNLGTGQLTQVDVIGGDNDSYDVKSIAIPLNAVPEPVSLMAMGLGMMGLVLRPQRGRLGK